MKWIGTAIVIIGLLALFGAYKADAQDRERCYQVGKEWRCDRSDGKQKTCSWVGKSWVCEWR